jgi:hypothetical protein
MMKGKRPPRLDPRLSDDGFVTLLRDRVSREPINRIAGEFHVTPSTVRSWARRFDIKLPRAGARPGTSAKRGLQLLGLSARDPEVVESLRLLLEREQYSYTDIAMMFEVSRERVRQWTTAAGIKHEGKQRWQRGLSAERIWDDRLNRFIPFAKSVIRERRVQATRLLKRTQRMSQIWRRREEIIEQAEQLRAQLGREPNLGELTQAVTGDSSNTPDLYSRWFGTGNPTQKGRAAEFKQGLASALGWSIRDGRRDRLSSRRANNTREHLEAAAKRRIEARERIVETARALRVSLGAAPTQHDLATPIFGAGASALPRLIRSWCGSTNAGASSQFRSELQTALGWTLSTRRMGRPSSGNSRRARNHTARALSDVRDWIKAQNRGSVDDSLLAELDDRIAALAET